MPHSDDVRGGPTVHVVGPNPALDRVQVVPALVVGGVNRASTVVVRAGGKGMIVARGVRRLGGRAALHGFVGGAAGEELVRGCGELGVVDHHVRIAGETRTTTVLVEEASGASTVVNEPGPEVPVAAVAELVAGVRRSVGPGDVVVATGSLPRGVRADLHADVARTARERGALAVVDTSGAPLESALRAAPAVLKVNEHELRAVAAGALSRAPDADLEVLMARVLALGAGAVIVTLGAAGLRYRSPTGAVDVAAPAVTAVNATGSGDLMLAGLVTALAAGEDLVAALQLGAAAGAAGAAQLEPDLDDPALVRRLRAGATAVRRSARA